MIDIFKISSFIVLSLFSFKTSHVFQLQEIQHKIHIKHPGVSLTDKVEKSLVEIKNEEGRTTAFYMDVKTVVCGDSQCKIDIVRIYWNELGFYERLVLPKGVELEKAEGEYFTPADYEKLDNILADKNNSLRDVYKEEVVGSESTEGVDAITGATIILHTNDYVKGAVWTCYTLWHWVNGGAVEIIRNITGDNHSIDDLNVFLSAENKDYQLFALEQIFRRKNFDPQTVESVIAAIGKTPELIKPGLQYLESASTLIFQSSIKQLLNSLDEGNRLKCLNAILKTKHELPQVFYEQISFQISNFHTYQEIHLFFNILENKNAVSPQIISQLMPLLDSDSFLIARRVFWFLQERNLSGDQESKLEAFRMKNEARL